MSREELHSFSYTEDKSRLSLGSFPRSRTPPPPAGRKGSGGWALLPWHRAGRGVLDDVGAKKEEDPVTQGNFCSEIPATWRGPVWSGVELIFSPQAFSDEQNHQF